MESPPGKGSTGPTLKGTQFIGLGFEMVVPIVLLMYVGYRLDAWLDSRPYLVLLGAFLGFAMGLYGMLRRVGVLGSRRGEK